jgi:hypothetical protein
LAEVGKILSKCRNVDSLRVIVVKPREVCGSNKEERITMKYALLVHQPQEQFDRRDEKAAVAAGRAYAEALQGAGVFVAGAGLYSPKNATTVTVRDGKRHVHDGPYAETKEFLAGFGIIDVPNLDAALEWAARHPAAGFATIEVRPLLGFGVAPAKSR